MNDKTEVVSGLFYNRQGCQCLHCGIFKPWTCFERSEKSVTGYSFICGQCNQHKSWYGEGQNGTTALSSTQAA